MPLPPPSPWKRLLDPRVVFLYAVLLAYALWPALQALAESVWAPGRGPTIEPWRQFFREGHAAYAMRSLGISAATVALAGAFGTALSFVYARLDFPGRTAYAGLALLPFTLPPLVGVFAIWTLLAEGGMADQAARALTGRGFWIEKGYGGVLLVHVYSMFVYFYVMVGGALAGFDEAQLEAARDLGATRAQAFFRVMLPQLAPALAGASLLTFMTSMASFTAPFFYMAGRPTLTVGIQQAVEGSAYGLASADCVALALAAAAFLALIQRFEGAIEGGTKGVSRARAKVRSPLARWGLCAGCGALTLALVAPHLAMLRESLVEPGTGFVGRPASYTFGNYSALLRGEESWRPIGNSLKASALATAGAVLFSMLSAWMEARRAVPGKPLLRALIMLPWALPGTVIGVGLLWMTRAPGPLTLGFALRGTIAILALAYFIRLFPLAHRAIRSGLARAPEELDLAARDLGASPLQAFLRVTGPLILGAILAAATLTFVTAMGEFVSSILLAGPGNEPISVKIDALRRGPGGLRAAAAYSALLTALITATFLAFGRSSRRAFD